MYDGAWPGSACQRDCQTKYAVLTLSVIIPLRRPFLLCFLLLHSLYNIKQFEVLFIYTSSTVQYIYIYCRYCITLWHLETPQHFWLLASNEIETAHSTHQGSGRLANPRSTSTVALLKKVHNFLPFVSLGLDDISFRVIFLWKKIV